MEATPPFIPPHKITDTFWYEWLGEPGQFTNWTFEETRLLIKYPDNVEVCGSWSQTDGRIIVQVPQGGELIAYTGTYRDDLVRPGGMLTLEATERIPNRPHSR